MIKWFWCCHHQLPHFSNSAVLSLQPRNDEFHLIVCIAFGMKAGKVRCRNVFSSLEEWDSPESQPEVLFIRLSQRCCQIWSGFLALCCIKRAEQHLWVWNRGVCWNQTQLENEWFIHSGRWWIIHFISTTSDEITVSSLWIHASFQYSSILAFQSDHLLDL